MGRRWIAVCALLGLAACREERTEALGAERETARDRPGDPIAGEAAGPLGPEPIDPSTVEQGTETGNLVCMPIVQTETPAEPAESRSSEAASPKREETMSREPKPAPRPEDERPDQAPTSPSPLPLTTPPERTIPPSRPANEPREIPAPAAPDMPFPGNPPLRPTPKG
jgi:hypothetical protein